jgi:acetyltransferase-like isoleucine patch superfamily enzyme
MTFINDNTKPLIFLGSSMVMGKLFDICDDHGIEIAGIIDNDYYGNRDAIDDVPIIDTELSFDNEEKCRNYRDNYNFFCANNWQPLNDPVSIRNKEKRFKFLNLIDDKKLNCITLVSKTASVSKRATLGKGVFIDTLSVVEPGVSIGDHSMVFAHAIVGHHMKLGKNCVVQRKSFVAQASVAEDNCYFGLCSITLKTNVVFRKDTFVQEGIYLKRGTKEGEIVTPLSTPRVGSCWTPKSKKDAV